MLRDLWKRYWIIEIGSAFDNLATLSSHTWVLPPEQIETWLDSNQRDPLLPVASGQARLYLLNLLLGAHTVRLVLYVVLYALVFESRGVGKPRLPFYLGDAFQLMSSYAFYMNIAAAESSFYCWLTSMRFHLGQLLRQKNQLRWYRILLYIDAIIRLDYHTSRLTVKLLRNVTRNQYQCYQNKFRRVLRIRTFCLRVNHLTIVIFFTAIFYPVLAHPEWNHSIPLAIVIDLTYQLWYYYWFAVIISVQTSLYLNSTFATMLLKSMEERFRKRVIHERQVLRVVHLFDQSLQLVSEVNRFWRIPLSDYYFLLIPSGMTAFYVLLFVPIEPLFFIVVTNAVLMTASTMHLNNWVAASVRRNVFQLYRTIYHRGIILAPNLSLNTKLKVHTSQ